MLKKVLLAGVAAILVVGVVLYFYAQSILASDLVRRQIETRLSQALGQPVAIGRIGATIFPRVTVALGDVRIGDPARISIAQLDLGTSLRALFSRRVEHATAVLTGARIELPLPAFTFTASSAPADEPSGVTIVSIDEVILNDVEIVSGGRSLRGNVDVVPHDNGMTIRGMTMGIGDAEVRITGEIASVDGPVGTLALTAGRLDLLALQAFASDFAAAALPGGGTTTESAPASTPMNIAATITTDRAVIGTLILEGLSGQARLTNDRLTLEPVAFRIFEGAYDGTLVLGLANEPELRTRATLTNVNMGALMAFVGQPDVITGRFSGSLDASARGLAPDQLIRTAQGTARTDIVQGTVKGLGLVRSVVVATSGRADAAAQPVNSGAEPFSRLGATLAIGGGIARTEDLRFESNDVLLAATGSIALDGSRIDLAGPLQLSDALSQQAGRDLVRYTQQGGRVTIPARVTGSASSISVSLDTADLLKRAVINKATEEAGEAIKRGLGGLLGR